MSLLYTITAYVPSPGGAQIQLHELVKRIALRESAGVIYHWDEPRTDWLYGTTLNAPPAGRPAPLEGVPVYRLSLTAEQRRALRFDVWFYRLFQGRAIDRISGVLLANLRDAMRDILESTPRLIHNSRVGREGLTTASLKLAHELGVPFVFTPNHHHTWEGWLYRHYLEVYRRADALIAYTDFGKQELIHLGVSPDRVHVLGVGALLAENPDGGRFRRDYHIPDDVPLVLFLGQKYAYKRFHVILEAAPLVWKHFPRTHFVFVGPRTPFSEKKFRNVHDSRIIEMGAVDVQTKTDALAACDLLCMPSARESFGGIYLEAWQIHKPVIGGDAPAVQEVITHGETGFIVGADVSKMADYIVRLLSDSDLSVSMAAAGYGVAQRYDWQALSERLYAIYETIT